jgi:hypothetical protein
MYGEDLAAKQAAVQRLIGDRNAAQFIDAMIRQAPKLEKDRTLRDRASMDMPGGYEKSLVAFTKKWKDLLVAIGTPLLDSAMKGLDMLTKGIIALTGWVNEHPETVKNLAAAAAGIGLLSTALGTLAIGVGIAGLLGGGVIIVGLTALAGGLAGLAILHWDSITSGLKSFDDAITNFQKLAFDTIAAGIRSIGTAISDLWERIKGFVSTLGGLLNKTSFGGGGGGGGDGVTKASWSGGGGGVNVTGVTTSQQVKVREGSAISSGRIATPTQPRKIRSSHAGLIISPRAAPSLIARSVSPGLLAAGALQALSSLRPAPRRRAAYVLKSKWKVSP